MMNQQQEIPVYLFTGFLGGGKTTFIQDILSTTDFNEGERTLLLLCEEGEEDYDPSKFSYPNVYIETIEDEEDLTQESVSHALGISASHLSHFFTEKLHVNFRQYINTNRMARARLMMRDTGYTLTMIADACGYSNMRTFRRAFLKEFGSLPSAAQYEIRNSISPE